VNLTTRLVRT